jgi:hypothetical protein
MSDVFQDKAFDIEHALIMYARDFVTIPAFAIYEPEALAPLQPQIKPCHIYLIGLTPKIQCVGVAQNNRTMVTSFEIRGKRYDLDWPMPDDTVLVGDGEEGWCVEHSSGTRMFPDDLTIGHRLSSEYNAVDFKVLYIGQAYGEDGSRNALDRLKKHETLQKIAVKGIPADYNLTILMLAIEPAHRLVTVINPRAKDRDHGSARIKNGLDKLFGTNEAERTTLYEASLIRYFQPKFNIEFKNSFPSTNLKLLADCYDKDFSALVAEINFDDLPFVLFSDTVLPKPSHAAKHDLHTDPARRIFFS